MATKPATTTVELPKLDIRLVEVRIVGDSPLICHAWSDKAKRLMLDKQMKKAKAPKEAKDPLADYAASLYWLSEKPEDLTPDSIAAGTFGFPTVAFKASAVGACRFIDGFPMTQAKGAFHIMGEFAQIEGTPEMREDMVRLQGNTADIRHRGEFREWATTVTLRYNAAAFSLEQILNLLNTGGFAQGVGEWRPEKGGSFGMFHIATHEGA